MNTASVCARVEIMFFTEVILLLTLSQAVHHVISTKEEGPPIRAHILYLELNYYFT